MRTMFACVLAAAVTMIPAAAGAQIECRIRLVPPESYASMPLPSVQYQGLPLGELQLKYEELSPRSVGLFPRGHCGILGFVEPGSPPTIYFPTDVTNQCRTEVIAHEQAHVKGWPGSHPRARVQVGPCAELR